MRNIKKSIIGLYSADLSVRCETDILTYLGNILPDVETRGSSLRRATPFLPELMIVSTDTPASHSNGIVSRGYGMDIAASRLHIRQL